MQRPKNLALNSAGKRGICCAPTPHHQPKKNEHGKPVIVSHPSVASSNSTWHNHNAVATFIPDGDTPSDTGWESQAVHLVPKGLLYDYLNMWPDHAPAEAVGAGVKPTPPFSKN